MTIPSTIRKLFEANDTAIATATRPTTSDAFPIARLPMAANAASNLARDLDTHLPERMSSADHATVARLIAARSMQAASTYAWLAHTLATEPHDWPAIVGRIEALVSIEQDTELLKVELLRHRLDRLRDAIDTQFGKRSLS